MATRHAELIEKVETLKNMLVSRATGEGAIGLDFAEIRAELLNETIVKDRLPRFVRTCRNLDEFWGFIQPRFAKYHERRTFLKDEFDPILTFLETYSGAPSDEAVTIALADVGSDYVRDAWAKALERRNEDAEGAITSARTLLESVCKHILEQKAVQYDDSADLPKLYALSAKELNLAPEQHSEQVFKQILGSCQQIVNGLGALRNRHGDAHGKAPKAVRVAPRHAELAVNLAGGMATFLIRTWEEKVKGKP